MQDAERVLFTGRSLRAVLLEQESAAMREISTMDPDGLLSTNPTHLVETLITNYRMNVPVLDEDGIAVTDAEGAFDIYVAPLLSRAVKRVRGIVVTYHIPYHGDQQIFYCMPYGVDLNFRPNPGLKALATAHELVVIYRVQKLDAKEMRNRFATDLARIKDTLAKLDRKASAFNDRLPLLIEQQLAIRRDQVLKDRGQAASLGYKLRDRPDAPKTYILPAPREKRPVLTRPTVRAPFAPEPELDAETYEKILSIVQNMTIVMERSPRAFVDMKEEELRSHFLVQLNGHFEGSATGETFNYEGKTDILIRERGRNVFIAECKFWDGPTSLADAINQILGYSSWRDTKTAVIVFNRNKNFSDVLAKIPATVTAHPNFRRPLPYQSETAFRFALSHRDDPDRELTLIILAFDVPRL